MDCKAVNATVPFARNESEIAKEDSLTKAKM